MPHSLPLGALLANPVEREFISNEYCLDSERIRLLASTLASVRVIVAATRTDAKEVPLSELLQTAPLLPSFGDVRVANPELTCGMKVSRIGVALDRFREEEMTILPVDQMAGLALADRAYVIEGGYTVITTYGRDFATANTEFTRLGEPRIGRQSHTWLRMPDGWKIVAAHVSLMETQ